MTIKININLLSEILIVKALTSASYLFKYFQLTIGDAIKQRAVYKRSHNGLPLEVPHSAGWPH